MALLDEMSVTDIESTPRTDVANRCSRTKLLRRKFAERFTSPDTRFDVNYRAFLAAVDLAAEQANDRASYHSKRKRCRVMFFDKPGAI